LSYDLAYSTVHSSNYQKPLNINLAIDSAIKLAQKNKLTDSWVKLFHKQKKQMTPKKTDKNMLLALSNKLREIMINNQNIGHNWPELITPTEQLNSLYDYIYVNKLILDCLNCQSYVSKAVREKILDQLLIPPNL
jgi:hypothetical protein